MQEKMSSQQIGICLLVMFCLFEAANAVKCFECESISNPACGEDFDKEMILAKDCSKAVRPRFIVGSKNSTSCVKMVKEERGEINIVRACFFENSAQSNAKCIIDPQAESVFRSCDLCATDLCNGSVSMYGSMLCVLSTAAALILKSVAN